MIKYEDHICNTVAGTDFEDACYLCKENEDHFVCREPLPYFS